MASHLYFKFEVLSIMTIMDTEKTPMLVGVRTTTLKEIQEQVPERYVFIKADLFDQPHSQDSRFVDKPEGVPFMSRVSHFL